MKRLFMILGALAGLALVAMYGLSRPSAGDAVPVDCDPSLGGMVVASAAPGTVPALSPGDTVRYRIHVNHPSDDLGVACDVTDIDVFFKLPQASRYRLVCRVPRLSEGSAYACPGFIEYEVRPADADAGFLRTHVRAIANLDHDVYPCVTLPHKRDPRRSSDCVDSTDVTTIGPVVDTP